MVFWLQIYRSSTSRSHLSDILSNEIRTFKSFFHDEDTFWRHSFHKSLSNGFRFIEDLQEVICIRYIFQRSTVYIVESFLLYKSIIKSFVRRNPWKYILLIKDLQEDFRFLDYLQIILKGGYRLLQDSSDLYIFSGYIPYSVDFEGLLWLEGFQKALIGLCVENILEDFHTQKSFEGLFIPRWPWSGVLYRQNLLETLYSQKCLKKDWWS